MLRRRKKLKDSLKKRLPTFSQKEMKSLTLEGIGIHVRYYYYSYASVCWTLTRDQFRYDLWPEESFRSGHSFLPIVSSVDDGHFSQIRHHYEKIRISEAVESGKSTINWSFIKNETLSVWALRKLEDTNSKPRKCRICEIEFLVRNRLWDHRSIINVNTMVNIIFFAWVDGGKTQTQPEGKK